MAEAMTFKLLKEAEKNWKRICGYDEIPRLLSKTLYKNGEVLDDAINQRGI